LSSDRQASLFHFPA